MSAQADNRVVEDLEFIPGMALRNISYHVCRNPPGFSHAALNETLAVCRLVYNSMAHKRTALHEQGLKSPTFYTQVPKEEKALAKAGRRQAKTKKRSPERRKANKVLSRIHERIRNRRHDFVHQTARRLVNRYGVIAVEKLSVKTMLGNHCLAKSI